MSEARITGTTDPEDNGGNTTEVAPQAPPVPAAKVEVAPPEPEEPKVGKDGVVELEKPVGEPKEPLWLQRRIDAITAQREAAKRETEQLRIQLAEFAKPKDGDPVPANAKGPTPEEIQAHIQSEAQRIAHANEAQRVYDDGCRQFPNFPRAVQDLNDKAMLDSFSSEVIMEFDDPAKVFMALAQDLDESSRLFSIQNPRKKIQELTKFALKLDAPMPKAQRTRAPDPIEPKIGGPGKQDVDLDSDSISAKEWIAERERQVKEKRKTDKRLR